MRVTILVDGDNISGAHAPAILQTGKQYGTVDVARVYTNAATTSAWHTALGYHLIHSGTGKNATDMLIAIEAMEFAQSRANSTFVIATSDGDFTHLALRLRECGITVIGTGEAKAPAPFRAACTVFRQLKPAGTCSNPGSRTVTDFDTKIRTAIAGNSQNGQGIPIGTLNALMHKLYQTKIGTYPEGNWRAYLSARPTLYDLDLSGPQPKVRVRPEGFSEKHLAPAKGLRPIPKILACQSTTARRLAP